MRDDQPKVHPTHVNGVNDHIVFGHNIAFVRYQIVAVGLELANVIRQQLQVDIGFGEVPVERFDVLARQTHLSIGTDQNGEQKPEPRQRQLTLLRRNELVCNSMVSSILETHRIRSSRFFACR
jgi:hypothetical protein